MTHSSRTIRCSSVPYRQAVVEVAPGIHPGCVNIETWQIYADWKDPRCPWKGQWRSLDVSAGGKTVVGGAWSYVDPTPSCQPLRGHAAFFPEKMSSFKLGWGLFNVKLPFS